jgi:hypothetical protein
MTVRLVPVVEIPSTRPCAGIPVAISRSVSCVRFWMPPNTFTTTNTTSTIGTIVETKMMMSVEPTSPPPSGPRQGTPDARAVAS